MRRIACRAYLPLLLGVTPQGRFGIAGTVFTENENTCPVTGGTGAFRGAGGQLSTFDVDDTTPVLFFQFAR